MSNPDIENLIETIVAEVVSELARKGISVVSADKVSEHKCSCTIKEVNPSNCKTSELSKKYLISIKAELNDCMVL